MYLNLFKVGDLVWIAANTSEINSGFEIMQGVIEEVVINPKAGSYYYRVRLPENILAVVEEVDAWSSREALIEHFKSGLEKSDEDLQRRKVYLDRVRAAIMEANNGTD